MVTSEEFSGTTKYLTLYMRCRINRCRHNRVPMYIICAVNMSLPGTRDLL
jgi:hypothetical protein